MTENKGWIKLHRKIKDNWLWNNDKPFDKRSAWIDILLMVNHKDNKFLFDNKLIEVEKGERITSERKLSDKWGWSRTKVRNFLELLEKDKMIVIKKTTKRTAIKVVNFTSYQSKETAENTKEVPQKNQPSTTEEPVEDTNKNDKECLKNDKENNNYADISTEEKKILNILQQINNYPFDYETDLKFIKEKQEQFSNVNFVNEIDKWKTYKLDNPLEEGNNPRSQIHTWIKNASIGKYKNKGKRKVADF